MISVNLLPIERKNKASQQKAKVLMTSALYIVATTLAAVTVVLFFITQVTQQSRIDSLKEDTDIAINSINEEGDENINKLLTLQSQLESIPTLHENKAVSSRLFGYLDKLVPTNVTLTDVTVGYSGSEAGAVDGATDSVEISGLTTDYNGLNIFVDIIKNAEFNAASISEPDVEINSNNSLFTKAFSNVKTLSASSGGSGLQFTLSFNYRRELFMFTVGDINFRIPNIKTSVSEQERPTKLFTEKPEETEVEGDQL